MLDTKYRVTTGEIINDLKSGKFLNSFSHTDKSDHFVENIAFDRRKRYIVGWGNTKVLIYNLKDDNNQVAQELHLKTEIFDKIYHLRFISFRENNDEPYDIHEKPKYICTVASKKREINQICVYDLNDKHLFREKTANHNHVMSINFYKNIDQNTKVYISRDCNDVAFINGIENFILGQKKETVIQYVLP